MQNKITIAGRTYEGASGGATSVKQAARFVPSGIEVVEIDGLLAAMIKEEATLPMPGQRNLDAKTVHEYKRLMANGLWHLSTIYIVEMIHADGSPEMRQDIPDQPLCYLVNGNHTLQAVIESGMTISALVSTFRATRDSMQVLYSQIDNYRTRKVTTAMEPLAKTFGQRPSRGKAEGKNLLPAKVLETIVDAIQWVTVDSCPARPIVPKRDVAVAHAMASRAFIRWLINLNHNPEKPFGKDIHDKQSESFIWKIPVIAAMWKTWKISEVDATNFWSQITKPTPKNDVVLTNLRETLAEHPKTKDWGGNPNLRIFKLCAMAWKAWRESDANGIPADFNDVLAISDESLSVILFDNDAIGTTVQRPKNAVVKSGTLDRRSSAEEERTGNDEEHHITVSGGVGS